MDDRARPADPDGTHGPHVFVDDLDALELRDEDRHHLARVVRLRDGDPLTVADGRGRWRPARFGAALEPTGAIVEVPAPRPAVTVGFALVKGSRVDAVTRHLTELGVDVIVPFVAARSVVRWSPETAPDRHARLVRIAREAAMQCRRARLPEVEPLAEFDDLVTRERVALAQMGGPAIDAELRGVLVGPEGGWTDAELARARATVGLADHVLRAETAALTAGALLADRRRCR